MSREQVTKFLLEVVNNLGYQTGIKIEAIKALIALGYWEKYAYQESVQRDSP